MATVSSQLLKLIQRIDPRQKDGTETTSSNLETATTGWQAVGGDRFAAQRVVDLYNDARRFVAMGIITSKGPLRASYDLSSIVANAAITFTSGVANLPTGHLATISVIRSETGALIKVIPTGAIDYVSHLDSAANPIVFELSGTLYTPNGATYIPDSTTGVTYKIRYYNCTDWSKAQAVAVGSPVTETFPERFLPLVIDIAELMANEQGGLEPAAVLKKVMGAA